MSQSMTTSLDPAYGGNWIFLKALITHTPTGLPS